ncbi:MAG: MFS transporter [Spirosomataceae bacterium]
MPPFRIISFGLLLVTLSVNVAMPLFRVYAAEAGLNNGQTALVFAAYITGMLPCYIFLGGISDRVGRKPVLIISVLCAFLATLLLALFPTVTALIFARMLQGVALALSMGTGTAYLAEVLQPDKMAATKAANLASLSTAIGFSGGALATTLYLLYEFKLVPPTYYLLLAVTLIGLLLLFTLPNPRPIGGNLLRLPYFPKGAFPVNMAIAICWAVTGIVIAIIPTQLAQFNLTSYAGFCLVLINWTGAFLQPFIRQKDPKRSVRIGYILVPAGFGLVILGCYLAILSIILLGTALIGLAAYGYSYVGGLALIANYGGQQRARAVSGYLFFGYIGFGIPAVFLGYLSDRIGIVNALLVFEAVIVLLTVYLMRVFRG